MLRAKLPPLQTVHPSMPGEDKGAKRRCFVPRPEAHVRLFLLYGIADVAMSLEPWIRAAANLDWLEIRLVDLPGHGFRTHEELPACSRGVEGVPADLADLAFAPRSGARRIGCKMVHDRSILYKS